MLLSLLLTSFFCLFKIHSVASLSAAATQRYIFLQDISTPSFIIDLDKVRAAIDVNEPCLPSIALSKCTLRCSPLSLEYTTKLDTVIDSALLSRPGVCYLHASVQSQSQGDPTYLVALDLPPRTDAHLVLGLNNHHVGSYYWARSAGAGAAMEAPGIVLNDDGRLVWQSSGGFTECNSNDGKRSEWVNFLKPGDLVQLMPHDPELILEQLQKEMNEGSTQQQSYCGVYGVSSIGRPLGSEPIVVCEWKY